MAAEPGWQFWIDVGGTFTDCIAQAPNDGAPDEEALRRRLRRLKLLSSAVTKLTAGDGSTRYRVMTDRREPNDFWRGYRLRHLDADGRTQAEVVVATSFRDEGHLELVTPLDRAPAFGDLFELITDEEAPILAIRRILELQRDQPIPAVSLRLGTTRGTNALLTRSGARTGLVTTVGLGDFLTIGYQDRPKLFELAITKPTPLFAQTVEIQERISSDGRVLIEPAEAQIRDALASMQAAGITSLAICLLNAYRDDRHEVLVERIAREMGFDEI
ncbi:MAG: hydantoinase/oxoprolinase N-terminal domain-containing protein, partial [Pirellulaceae bacterium]|nr:hydantoinase/oxoprolinase N-terminal domain-containing protein [Pirellulaceae bacterium]